MRKKVFHVKRVVVYLLLMVLVASFLPSAGAATETTDIYGDYFAEVKVEWDSLVENNGVYVNGQGFLEISNTYTPVRPLALNILTKAIVFWNEAIEYGILSAESSPLVLTATTSVNVAISPEDYDGSVTLETYSGNSIRHISSIVTSNVISSPLAAHCSRPSLDLIDMCETNYQTITDFWDSQVLLQSLYPTAGFDPYVSTISYWIGHVQEGGTWDYKSKEGFSPSTKQFCSYYDGSYHHITSEYIGNFNYGYTGSFLFSLSTLQYGSYAVSGFDPEDIYTDWPAVTDGYNAKVG